MDVSILSCWRELVVGCAGGYEALEICTGIGHWESLCKVLESSGVGRLARFASSFWGWKGGNCVKLISEWNSMFHRGRFLSLYAGFLIWQFVDCCLSWRFWSLDSSWPEMLVRNAPKTGIAAVVSFCASGLSASYVRHLRKKVRAWSSVLKRSWTFNYRDPFKKSVVLNLAKGPELAVCGYRAIEELVKAPAIRPNGLRSILVT